MTLLWSVQSWGGAGLTLRPSFFLGGEHLWGEALLPEVTGTGRRVQIPVRILWHFFQTGQAGDILRSSHKMAERPHTAHRVSLRAWGKQPKMRAC